MEMDYEGAAEIERAWREGLTPDPLLTVSEWSDRHRMLSSKASAEPGRWRTSRTPYLKAIMDCLSPTSPVERVVFMKAAQLGATEMGSNWIGYVIHHAPGPMMAVWPTVEMAKRNSKQRIDPLIEESAALAELIAPARSRDSGNTILGKEFRGGVLVMTGANSAVGLRSMPVRYLFLDEVDGYPLDVEGEGDAISLAEARTRTFTRRKIFIVSTPTISGASAIEREYEASDQRRYFVPCPHCSHRQWLRFEQLRWDKGAPETAAYRLIPALITAWQTAGAAAVAAASATSAAWATANLSISAAVTSVGLLKTAFAVLGAFLVGWEIGTWLSEKFEVVRKAGIFMVEMVVKAVEQLQYRWEAFAAIFTSDTIDQATQRHQQRLVEMNQIFGQMYADAGRGAEAAKGAMNTAATAAEEIAKRLEAVRLGTQEAVGRGVEAVHTALEKLKSRLGEVEQAVGKANQTVNDSTAKMASSYQGLTTLVEANLQRQVEAVKARFQQEQSALELKTQSETAQITKSTQLLTEALTQQTGLRQQASTATLKLIDAESTARIEAARRQGQTETERSANVTRVENEILATKRQTLTQALAEYRQHVDALNAEANRHLAEVQRIEGEKRQLSMTTEERIREIARQGMSEFQANEDRKRQIAELQQQARQALANGELDLARQLAQKAMDLAAQVATSQTNEAKRAEDAKKQSEQNMTQVVQLEAQSREAYRKQEYASADQLMRQAEALRAEISQKSQAADQAALQSKSQVAQAIGSIRTSEDLLNQALDAEAKAHRTAAQSAISARDDIQRTLSQTQGQIDEITAKLAQGLKLTLDADASRFQQAIVELDKAMAEKAYLLQIQADLQQAEQKLKEYEQLLKDGKTLPVDADISKAQAALDKLKAYADQQSQLELKVATEKAQASITNVAGMIRALDRIQTESRHTVSSNADAVRAQIASLNGANTSSTHTIYVRRVEANAAGGLVGAGISRFATGGSVGSPLATAFAPMRGGRVPGTGNQDTVPRTLQAGAFVLRKAAVRKYGGSMLAQLAGGVARFATGGRVGNFVMPVPKQNRDAAEALKMIELGMSGMDQYTNWLQHQYGAFVSLDTRRTTLEYWGKMAQSDRRALESFIGVKQLTTNERQTVDRIRNTWREAMAQPLIWGKDLERDLIDYMDQNQGQFYRGGGLARSDTVPAMLTPGEYVVNREAVARFGSGFFDALNRLTLPAQAVAQRVQGFASGGLVQPSRPILARPDLPADSGPVRTVRVELAAGDRKVNASIAERDEASLLQLLQVARARAV